MRILPPPSSSPVQHHVVGERTNLLGLGIEQLEIVGIGRRERVVDRRERAVLIALEQWKVRHPEKDRLSSGTNDSRCATSCRTRSSAGLLICHPRPQPTRQLAFCEREALHPLSVRNFAAGPSSPVAPLLRRISPPAPADFAMPSSSSTCLRESAAPPGTFETANPPAGLDRGVA